MECNEVLHTLILFIDGELFDSTEFQSFENHLANCPKCLSEAEREREVLSKMKAILAQECCEVAPEELHARITEQTARLASQMFTSTQIITEYRRTETTINGETHIEIETTHEIRGDFPLS